MTKIQETIKEINDIINYLKANTTYANPIEKSAWEQRINKLTTNDSTHELSLLGLAQLDTNFALQIAQLISEKTQLAAEKHQMESERDNKNSLLTTKEAELAQKEVQLQAKITEIAGLAEAKLTKDLVDKLNALSADQTNLTAVKSSLEEITKGLQEVKEKGGGLPTWVNHLIFGTAFFSCLGIYYFFPKNKKKKRKDFDFDE